MEHLKTPTGIFEVSWEVCNKVGGIHTVVSTKVLSIAEGLGNNYITIGPDLWRNQQENPEFTEDRNLLASWKKVAQQEGLHIRIGRWNIAGEPIAVLVDYTPFIPQKNEILTDLWDKYGVDSMSGQWDYIEPVLFGYTAGRVIESYLRYHSTLRDRYVAQFHEWMTGCGLLYLKDKMPGVGCVFTTHATVLGRCIAGNGLPLYDAIQSYNPFEMARRFNVVAKQSMESICAQQADVFTTVSDITAKECIQFLGKQPDLITPNGFEKSFTPKEEDFEKSREKGRSRLKEIAEKVLCHPVADHTRFVGISGRYEFKNKGIDLFIDALGRLNAREGKEVIAFILVPSGHKGPHYNYTPGDFSTHELSDSSNDLVIRQLKAVNLHNRPEDRVKVVFCPSYLNGADGVFNLPYYDLLIGMDLTVFPSYYEPWGYTPLESIAFRVPTITTTLAGFGLYVNQHNVFEHPAVDVIERTDSNYHEVADAIADRIDYITRAEKKTRKKLAENADRTSEIALWKNMAVYYRQAYSLSIEKAGKRIDDGSFEERQWSYMEKRQTSSTPNFFNIIIQRSMPESLKPLEELSMNLWWCWNQEAIDLFESIDPVLWTESHNNPIDLLDRISLDRYSELENDSAFMKRLNRVYADFSGYMQGKQEMSRTSISYFCMEYGLHSSLKIYSGGLGILAGDYLKEASDKKTNLTAVGFLYRYGYFTQKLSITGEQESFYEAQDFAKLPVRPVLNEKGGWLYVSVTLPGRELYAKIWKVCVGRIDLYLLDTDFDANRPEDRNVTHQLYGGNWENRLKQEMLLGIGGIRALKAMGIQTDIYHCNEGHAAFIGIERLKNFMEEHKLYYTEALELVKASSLFTTHTPVPAGHDMFSEDLLRMYLKPEADKLSISWDDVMSLGKLNINDPNEKFSMSYLASNLSQEINGVSMLHGKVSQEILKNMWPGYLPEELHVSYVTNGVHHPTWTAPEWKEIENELFGKDFQTHHYDKRCFDEIYRVPDEKVMEIRNTLRSKLIRNIKERLSDKEYNTYFTPRQIVEIKETLRDDILTIGFARRFATYKRAYLLFKNLDRLNEIVNDAEHPVQFIFAGKAHPADKAGQDLIRNIVEISKMPQFLGKIIFLPNYDMDLARMMVQGVDVWMNTPTRPQEASGTSGEKAAMNGVMHFSVLDGWWVEGYRPDSGWALPLERTYENREFQDELDSETIYSIIESEITPTFYDKGENGISPRWTAYIKNTIAKVASNFTTNRMLDDYEKKYYEPMAARMHRLLQNDMALAKELADWKEHIAKGWDEIHVESMMIPSGVTQNIQLGIRYKGRIALKLGTLTPEEVGVEMVALTQQNGRDVINRTQEFTPVSFENGIGIYDLEITPNKPGQLKIGVRIFPKHAELPHRQDFALVKWL